MNAIKQQLKGTIISKPSDTMAVVECVRFIEHRKYRKFFKRSKTYHAEDETKSHKKGDTVIIEATRPRSRTKRWRIAVATTP
ncbi:MAG: mitochondrial small ribosomal subunit protein uS17m [Candidatus Niyogibacteria bacterium]|nr:mitochondrial small ribosomal subunit protein uS17m [Candidatus Niyogibacteria bacterium]